MANGPASAPPAHFGPAYVAGRMNFLETDTLTIDLLAGDTAWNPSPHELAAHRGPGHVTYTYSHETGEFLSRKTS